MAVQSLAWRTDVELLRHQGAEVSEGSDHVVVRTVANPTYRWGNFLLLTGAGTSERGRQALELFEHAFPAAGHVAIGLDTPTATEALLQALVPPLQAEVNAVLVSDAALPPAPAPAATELRPLRGEADWQRAVAFRLTVNEQEEQHGYREFLEREMRAVRGACERGHGAWFGAFRDGHMVAGLGIFEAGGQAGDGRVARYQAVDTHPAHRRQGLARSLLAHAGEWARTRLGAERLAIVADPDYFAIDLYRSMGFRECERQVKLERS